MSDVFEKDVDIEVDLGPELLAKIKKIIKDSGRDITVAEYVVEAIEKQVAVLSEFETIGVPRNILSDVSTVIDYAHDKPEFDLVLVVISLYIKLNRSSDFIPKYLVEACGDYEQFKVEAKRYCDNHYCYELIRTYAKQYIYDISGGVSIKSNNDTDWTTIPFKMTRNEDGSMYFYNNTVAVYEWLNHNCFVTKGTLPKLDVSTCIDYSPETKI